MTFYIQSKERTLDFHIKNKAWRVAQIIKAEIGQGKQDVSQRKDQTHKKKEIPREFWVGACQSGGKGQVGLRWKSHDHH